MAVIPVVGDRPARSWAYTIGLAGLGHPELVVVVGLRPRPAGRLLNAIAGRIREGHRFAEGDTVAVVNRNYHLARVDERHFERGKFAAWVAYYGALRGPHPTPRALEVVASGRKGILG